MKDSGQGSTKRRKLITSKDVQMEYLDMDIRKVRVFLNSYCSYKKIGNTYYYPRSEVERLLLDDDVSSEFKIDAY